MSKKVAEQRDGEMKSLIRALATGLTLSVATAAACRAADGGDIVAKGHALLEANCARCHGIGTDDRSTHPEAPPFRQVVTRYPPEDLAEALAEGIISGHPDMPEFVFQPPEIEAIVAYLNRLKITPARPPAKN